MYRRKPEQEGQGQSLEVSEWIRILRTSETCLTK